MAPEDSSLWLATAPARPPRPALAGTGARAEVAILGAGIAGLTTAYLLAREGVDVVVLEAAEIGAGATGHTTAKVTSAHGLCYADLRSRHDEDTAIAYAALNEGAIARIEEIAAHEDIDCGWRRRDAYTYTLDARRAQDLAAEADAARDAGLDARLIAETPLPFDVRAAVLVRGQAEFHPVEWLLGLAAAAERAGARIHEQSRAIDVSSGSPCTVRTAEAELVAERVIVATHHPTLDRGLFFARVRQERSYCLALDVVEPPPPGIFLSADEPTRSLRSHRRRDDGRELLLVGGEGHPVGQEAHTHRNHRVLEDWARERFDVRAVGHRWSAQDPMPPDGLPYVGRLVPFSDRVLVATGFRKWGMTNGTAAAGILCDLVLGRENALGATWSTGRVDPRAAGAALVRHNTDVARHFIADRLSTPAEPGELVPGGGAIVRVAEGRRAAGFRDDTGTLHLLGAACTHLGCELRFNEAERSWDCPCHGSRFDAVDGRVLEGPAVQPLEAMTPEGDPTMSDALATYLNDHLAGATLGAEHARLLEELSAGTPAATAMSTLASDIEADRDDLIAMMDRLGVERSAVKQATGWIAEKVARPKFRGTTAGDPRLGRFLALEALSLGVEGKLALWRALSSTEGDHPALDAEQLERLAGRAQAQRELLERERLACARDALTPDRVAAAPTG